MAPVARVIGAHTMRIKFVFALVSVLSLAITPVANAHAQVVQTNPVKGSAVLVSPSLVWIEYDGNLLELDEKKINSLTVTDSKGKRVDNSKTISAGARVSTKIKGVLEIGKYQVKYRVVSEDGHPVQGSYFFSVK